MARKLGFLGVKFRSSGFVGFFFLPSFDYPCHLKSRVPSWTQDTSAASTGSELDKYRNWLLKSLFIRSPVYKESSRAIQDIRSATDCLTLSPWRNGISSASLSNLFHCPLSIYFWCPAFWALIFFVSVFFLKDYV